MNRPSAQQGQMCVLYQTQAGPCWESGHKRHHFDLVFFLLLSLKPPEGCVFLAFYTLSLSQLARALWLFCLLMDSWVNPNRVFHVVEMH